MFSKARPFIVTALFALGACAPHSGKKSTEEKQKEGQVTTQPVAGSSALEQNFEITGVNAPRSAPADEKVQAFTESITGVFVSTSVDSKQITDFDIQIQMKDGRTFSFQASTLEGQNNEIVINGKNATSDNSDQTNIEVKSIKCLESCSQLNVVVTSNIAKTDVEANISIVLESKSTKANDEIGVGTVTKSFSEKVTEDLKKVDQVERAVSHIVGTSSGFVTYSLKNGFGQNVLIAGIDTKGMNQTPKLLSMQLGQTDSKNKLESVTFDGPAGQVQTLILKQSADVGLVFKLGFKTPLEIRRKTPSMAPTPTFVL